MSALAKIIRVTAVGLPLFLAGCDSSSSAHGITAPAATSTSTADATTLRGRSPAVTDSSEAAACGDRSTTLDRESCLKDLVSRLEADLDAALKRFTDRQLAPAGKVAANQTAWLTYRDAQCELEAGEFEGGSFAPVAYGFCQAALTRARLEDVRRALGLIPN